VVRGTITIWHSWDESQRPALFRRIAAFQELYPDVQFDVLYVPSVDLRASYEAALAEGSGPDILIGPAEWGPELFDAGLVMDLTAFTQGSPLKMLNPAALGTAQYKGALVGIPESIQGVVLYRNRSLIPKSPATFGELVELSKAATRGEQIGAILDRSFFFAGGHLFGLGGSLVDANGDPAFNSEAGAEWVTLLQSFDQAGATDFFSENDLQKFKEGKVGFIVDGTWNRSSLAEAIGAENLSIDPWPIYGQGQLSGFVQAENFYLSAPGEGGSQNENTQLPWSFIQFLLEPESQAGLLEVGLIPAVLPANLPPVDADPLLDQAMQALSGGTAYPAVPDLPLYSTALDTALESVYGGGAPPAAALQAAYDSIQTARASKTSTP
jgi:maltose-binding protein MalE